MEKIIRKEQFYDHPIDSVWKAISEQDQISTWFILADFNAEVGYHYTFTHENTQIIGEVLEVNPVYELAYSWTVKGTSAETVVKWSLKEEGAGTLLILEHSGIEKYGEEAVITQMFESFDKGWDNCISELEDYLKKRQPDPNEV